MRGALGGPRVLLRRLREVMAEPVSAQERLDKIVVLIAANMVAEVCSVYVLRVDSTLELYATEGLKRDAVHQTVLRSDEGLVGLVSSQASAINLSNAQAHPAFSFRPEDVDIRADASVRKVAWRQSVQAPSPVSSISHGMGAPSTPSA